MAFAAVHHLTSFHFLKWKCWVHGGAPFSGSKWWECRKAATKKNKKSQFVIICGNVQSSAFESRNNFYFASTLLRLFGEEWGSWVCDAMLSLKSKWQQIVQTRCQRVRIYGSSDASCQCLLSRQIHSSCWQPSRMCACCRSVFCLWLGTAVCWVVENAKAKSPRRFGNSFKALWVCATWQMASCRMAHTQKHTHKQRRIIHWRALVFLQHWLCSFVAAIFTLQSAFFWTHYLRFYCVIVLLSLFLLYCSALCVLLCRLPRLFINFVAFC